MVDVPERVHVAPPDIDGMLEYRAHLLTPSAASGMVPARAGRGSAGQAGVQVHVVPAVAVQ